MIQTTKLGLVVVSLTGCTALAGLDNEYVLSSTESGSGSVMAGASSASTGGGGQDSGGGDGGFAGTTSGTGVGGGDALPCEPLDETPSGHHQFSSNDSCYYVFYGQEHDRNDARIFCIALTSKGQAIGADLAAINDSEEMNFVLENLLYLYGTKETIISSPWLDGRRNIVSSSPLEPGAWEWSTGEPWNIFPCDTSMPSCNDERQAFWGRYNMMFEYQPDGSGECVTMAITEQWEVKGLDDETCAEQHPFLCEKSLNP